MSTKYATIGVMSTMPNGGMNCRSGRRSGSVSVTDQRIHGEYAEMPNHDEITRTINAARSTENVRLTSSR
jgi:hypothetical protein